MAFGPGGFPFVQRRAMQQFAGGKSGDLLYTVAFSVRLLARRGRSLDNT